MGQIKKKLASLGYSLDEGTAKRPAMKIDWVFAYLTKDPDTGDDKIVAATSHFTDQAGKTVEVDTPLVAGDADELDRLRPLAQYMADVANIEIRVAKFATRIDADLIRPQRKKVTA